MLNRFSHVFVTLLTEASKFFCPWVSSGMNTRVGCHALLQGVYPTQESNPCLLKLLDCRWTPYNWATKKSPRKGIIGSNKCFPDGSAGKESACNVGDLILIPGLGRSPGEGKGYPFQYSGLENSKNCIVLGIKEFDRTKWISLSFSGSNKGHLTHKRYVPVSNMVPLCSSRYDFLNDPVFLS